MKHQIDFLELLQIEYEKYPVIAVVGGGGKTSLIFRLTDELLARGKKVIITTTTHMAGESELPFVRGGDACGVKETLEREGYVIAAEYEEETGKYAALPDEKLEELKELCDVMLVEADGAKHHPVKVPAEWEPVIPACADLVISVIGLDCLGQPISQSAYRMERTSEFLKKSLDAPITEEDIVKIATSICGLFKDVTELKITVVTQYEEIAKTAQAQGIQVLFNPHPELGISSSIKIGLNANTDADAQLFTVSDQPWLSWRTICELIREFQNSEKGIACVSYQGKMGNPCIFRKKYYEELSKLEGDRGGKKVIMKHPEDTQIIEVSDERELKDIDYKL